MPFQAVGFSMRRIDFLGCGVQKIKSVGAEEIYVDFQKKVPFGKSEVRHSGSPK